MTEKCRVHVSDLARIMESVQPKQARTETLEFRAIVKENACKMEETTRQLAEFQTNMLSFKRDMIIMRRAMQTNGHFQI